MIKMLSTSIVFIIINLISSVFSYEYKGSGFPYEKPNYPVEQVMSPWSLKTCDAKDVSVPRMELHIPKKTKCQLYNSGISGVEGYVTEGEEIILRGGPAINDEYILHGLTYYNNGFPHNTQSAIVEDDKSTALTHGLEFYKKVYGSPTNALNYSDGFIILLTQIMMSEDIENENFKTYENALQKVKQPFTKSVIGAKEALHWLVENLPSCDYYFSWPGTNFNSPNNVGVANKQYPAAVAVQIPRRCSPHISHSQFLNYPSILNKNYQASTGILAQFPRNNRPVVKISSGIKVHYC